MNSQTAVLTPIRRHDIDWLKVLLLYLLFAIQVSRVFDAEMNPDGGSRIFHNGFSYIGFLSSQWYVPFVFLVSGWSIKNAMQLRPGTTLLRDRLLRLIIPFTTGFILLVPLTISGGIMGDLLSAVPVHTGPDMVMDAPSFSNAPVIFNRPDTFAWSYLMFLPYLFVFTVLSWPFFTWLIARKVTPLKISRAWVYLPVVPLILIQMSIRGYWPGEKNLSDNWVMLLYFLAFFILGFVISRYSAYERAIHQEARFAGTLGAVLSVVILTTASNLPGHVFPLLTPIASWCCAVGILGLAKSYLDAPSSWLIYLLEASLPVFVLHQVSIVVISSAMDGFMIGTSARFMGLLLLSLGASIMLYQFIIRRFALMRVFFGLKIEKEPVESLKDQVFHRDHQ